MAEGLIAAAAADDRHETLAILRDRLAGAIETTTSARDLGSLTRRLLEVMDEIRGLPEKGPKVTPLAEFQARVARKREEGK